MYPKLQMVTTCYLNFNISSQEQNMFCIDSISIFSAEPFMVYLKNDSQLG